MFFLVKPSEGVQKPKLLEAIRSLKAVKIYQEINESDASYEHLEGFVNDDGLLIKENHIIKSYEQFGTKSLMKLNLRTWN